jgi:hypothetical protein
MVARSRGLQSNSLLQKRFQHRHGAKNNYTSSKVPGNSVRVNALVVTSSEENLLGLFIELEDTEVTLEEFSRSSYVDGWRFIRTPTGAEAS